MPRTHLGRTARLTVRLPPADDAWLAAEADRLGQSVNDIIVALVRAAAEAGRVPGLADEDARLAALDDGSAG